MNSFFSDNPEVLSLMFSFIPTSSQVSLTCKYWYSTWLKMGYLLNNFSTLHNINLFLPAIVMYLQI